MSWDDDEEAWDADDIEAKFEAQLKEREKAKKREEGLDSESEEETTAASPKAKASSEAKAKPKPKPKADKKRSGAPKEEPAASEGPVTQEEKLRRQKLVEEADARLANDLFSGYEKPSLVDREKEEQARKAEAARAAAEAAKPKVIVKDAWDEVELNVQADVDKLCTTCIDKLNKCQTKSVVVKFLSDCLKQMETSFDLKELGEVEKSIAEVVKVKTQEKGQRLAKDNKANSKLDKHTKFNASDEWEEVYGGGEGDEEWTQEEWDEWYKTQG